MNRIKFVFLMIAAASIFALHGEAQTIIIANNSVKASEVSKADLRDVFTGASTSFKDGSHVVPVLLKSGAEHEEFLTAYIGRNDTAFRAGWRSLVFSGQGSMPKSVDSSTAMVEFVAHNAGSIGYISKASPHDGVKVLAIK
jgi:ABC-type phosphate transport system substrate-binding protein